MSTRRIDAPLAHKWTEDPSGPKHDASCGCNAIDSDPRVKRIKAYSPNFDPRGKSDAYLDEYVRQLDTNGKSDSVSSANDREQAARDHAETAPPARPKSTIDEAYERADAEARRVHAAGPPATAQWVQRGERPASAGEVNTDGMSKIDAAQARADAEARRVHAAGPPEGASFVRR